MSDLQSSFYARMKGRELLVFLLNGIRLRGVLIGEDRFVILLKDPDGLERLVYKGAISTVSPAGAQPRKRRRGKAESPEVVPVAPSGVGQGVSLGEGEDKDVDEDPLAAFKDLM